VFKRGDMGSGVQELQGLLIRLGYALPRWGADGHLGNETLGAMARFLADHGGGYHSADLDAILEEDVRLVKHVAESAIPATFPGVDFFDLRMESNRGNIHGRRAWSAITGITLHQTACDLGRERPSRWDTLSAHVGASREGNVFWVHDFEHTVWHANELNKSTVGLECEGNYPGVVGHSSTVWQPGGDALMVVTPELVTAAQEAIRWICATIQAHGGKVTHLYAHRQTAGSRRADPGEELWKLVAMPMLGKLALSDGGPQFKLDNGRVIPEAWNPQYVGNPY